MTNVGLPSGAVLVGGLLMVGCPVCLSRLILPNYDQPSDIAGRTVSLLFVNP